MYAYEYEIAVMAEKLLECWSQFTTTVRR